MTGRIERQAALERFRAREKSQVSLLWILVVLLRERRTLLLFVAGALVIALPIALLRRTTWTSSFSFVPQTTQNGAPAALAGLADELGISLGTSADAMESPGFYVYLVETREILEPIAGDTAGVPRAGDVPASIAEFLGAEGRTDAQQLQNAVRILRDDVIDADLATRMTGVVTVRVRTRSPRVSLRIAERMLGELNRFNLDTRQSRAASEAKFVQGRLEASRQALRAAEDELQAFLQANRQITNSPALRFRQERLERAVTLRQDLVTELARQYEQARIREVRDIPVLTVVEKPALPARPDPRGRWLTLLAAASAAFFAGAAYVLGRAALARRARDTGDPAIRLLTEEWRRVRRVVQ